MPVEQVITSRVSDLFERLAKPKTKTVPLNGSPIIFPHGESGAAKFESKTRLTENTQALRELFYIFFNEELEQSQIYSSPEKNVELPFTKVDVTAIAKRMYKGNPFPLIDDAPSGVNIDILLEPREEQKVKKYFIFGTFLNTSNGQFTFVEQAMHEYMKKLRIVLRQLDRGEQPDQVEIYTIGSPTSQFGLVNEDFVKAAHRNPFNEFGSLYAEFVKTHMSQEVSVRAKTNVTFYGYSMGASLAAATAEQLVDQNQITASTKVHVDKAIPFAHVLMDKPAGYHKKRGAIGRKQTKVGYAIDLVPTFFTAEAIAALLGEKAFIKDITAILKDHGYQIRLADGQQEVKQKVIDDLTNAIVNGVDFDYTKIRPYIRRGIYDSTMFTFDFLKKARVRQKQMKRRQKSPLSRDAIKTSDRTRAFAIRANHMANYYNENEVIKRWRGTTDYYSKLKTLGKIKGAA